MVRVKVCGLKQVEDAEVALDAGADAVGFILEPASPRFIGDLALEPFRRIRGFSPLVGVFAEFDPLSRWQEFSIVQAFASSSLPVDFPILPVIRLGEESTLESALSEIRGAPMFMLDAAAPGYGGGTGQKVDWGLAAEIRQALPNSRLVLAGGLDAINVAMAVKSVRPYAVDASSGLEKAPGLKDHDRVRAFVAEAKGA